MRIIFTLQKSYSEYAETLHHLEEDADCIREMIKSLGFSKEDLRTTSIKMETDSFRVHGARREWGYVYHHKMELEFKSDWELLRRILHALAACPLKTMFEVVCMTDGEEKANSEYYL